MAIITKIRERSGLAVGIVAVGLILFLVGGDLLSPNSVFLGNNKRIVGEIAGQEVSFEEFSAEVERLRNNYAMATGQQPNEAQMPGLRQEAWNQMIFKIVYQEEFEKLGIDVTDEEIIDMVQGNNIHPSIAQLFTNPETGQVDRNMIVNFLRNMNTFPPQDQISFRNFEQNLRPDRLRSKYEALLGKTYYATTAEAKKEYEAQNSTADIRYVYVPYTYIPDSSVTVTDSEIESYYNKNKEKYEREANRAIEYVVFPIEPTQDDIEDQKNALERLKTQFETTEDDTAFVEANSDVNNNFNSYTPGQLPAELDVASLTEGGVYGPVRSGESFMLYKVLSIVEDTLDYAKASHILIQFEGDDKAAAKTKAQDVLNQIKGGADFAVMAAQYGSDGTRTRGGDLGWFDENTMVKPFNDAVMKATSLGLLPNLVETEFGYHIIEVTGLKTNTKYNIASVQSDIAPSSETIDMIYRKTINFDVAESRDDFIAAADKDSTLIRFQALTIGPNARNINNITESGVRQIVRWAYDDETEVGAVSEVFSLDEQYICANLTAKREKGPAKLDDVKDEIRRELVKEKQKEQILAKFEGMTGAVDDMRTEFGTGALVSTGTDITFNTTALPIAGFAPKTIGRVFSMSLGDTSEPIADENGVIVFEVDRMDRASEAANYALYKQQLEQNYARTVSFKIAQAMEKFADAENELYKYY
ncbi:SurA N-terminal domain-containing protein [Flammeovirgaceae bacterium SG7u.111]|nr:SurA N-terminal domain-containing protein [Flammeovirgaceae bacterium SG7u.132]WPO35284.1 SurA N-terminal domain-containing protein [Flammeovirgaceae bacterium SG7u.111]